MAALLVPAGTLGSPAGSALAPWSNWNAKPFEETPYTDRGHVFCIGANKAGTTSLWEWFNALPGNWNACHNECEGRSWSELSQNHTWDSPVFTKHRAFMDNGDSSDYKALYHAFDNSRFVLNARPLEQWVISRYDMIRQFRMGGGCDPVGTQESCPEGAYGTPGTAEYYKCSWTGNSDADIRSWVVELGRDQREQLEFFDRTPGHRNRFIMLNISDSSMNTIARMHWILRKDLHYDQTNKLLHSSIPVPSTEDSPGKWSNHYVMPDGRPGPLELPAALEAPVPHTSATIKHVHDVLYAAGCTPDRWGDLIYEGCATSIMASKLKLQQLPKARFPGDAIPLSRRRQHGA